MQDNSTQQGSVLSNRQERKLKKSQRSDVSCSLQDMMQSHQLDETGSGARSRALLHLMGMTIVNRSGKDHAAIHLMANELLNSVSMSFYTKLGFKKYVDPSNAAESPMNKEMYATPTRNDQASSVTIPNSMPTTIKVNESEESQMSSSIPGLGSSMLDMSMNNMTEEQEITLVKLCVNTKMFSFSKFYNRDGDGQLTRDEKKMCGFLIRITPKTKTPKNEE